MLGAIIKNNIVQNVIIIKENQIPSMSVILDCEIVDASPYGLCAGDLRTVNGWTRNIDGEQIILPLLTQQDYDSYSIAANRIIELEQKQKTIAQSAVQEALAILEGEEE